MGVLKYMIVLKLWEMPVNDLSQLINTLSNKEFAGLDKFKLRKIPTFNWLFRCQCKHG